MTDRAQQLVFGFSFFCIVFFILSVFGCVHTGPSIVAQQRDKITAIPAKWDSSVILLENRTELVFKVHRGGNRVKRKDFIWAYVRKRNPNYMERISFYDVETYEKPIKIKAKAYYPDGTRWILSSDGIKRSKIPFSNEFVNEFSVPRYDEDVLIQLETEREYFHPEFIGTFRLRNEHPALLRTISFVFPEDCDLACGLENPEEAHVQKSFIVENGYKKFEVTANKLSDKWARWKTEFPEQWYAAFYVSFPPKGKRSYTWRELGDHYLEISKDAFASSPEIESLAESVKGSTEKELIGNGFETIVRKIRYHADEEGRFAFFPRKAVTILEHGYGDCKEISTLMKTLLHSKKIDTHLAMISTRNHSQPVDKYPSLDNFNHVILAAGVQAGQYHFMDGTYTWANANNSYYHLIGRTAFLLKPGGSQLVRVSADNNYQNRIVSRAQIKHEESGDRWVIEGHIQLIGHPALRFFSELNWSDTTEKKSLAKLFLQNEFGIYPLNFDFKSPNGNEVYFTYKALFQENFIAMGQGGFRLAIPRLFDTSADDSLDQKKGPRLIGPFEQQDTWEFSQKPQINKLNAFHLPFADCDYSVEGTKITRTYIQENKLIQENDDQLETWTDKLKSTMSSTCWR